MSDVRMSSLELKDRGDSPSSPKKSNSKLESFHEKAERDKETSFTNKYLEAAASNGPWPRLGIKTKEGYNRIINNIESAIKGSHITKEIGGRALTQLKNELDTLRFEQDMLANSDVMDISEQELSPSTTDKDKGRASDQPSSDYIVPPEHIPALVDAVIASKQPGANQFSSRTFLQSIGVDDSKKVVIADADANIWRQYLEGKSKDRNIHKTLYNMEKSRLEKNRAQKRVENMNQLQIDANRLSHRKHYKKSKSRTEQK